jgi:hypothetical protein
MKEYRLIEDRHGFYVEVRRWWGWQRIWSGLSEGGRRMFMDQHRIKPSLVD